MLPAALARGRAAGNTGERACPPRRGSCTARRAANSALLRYTNGGGNLTEITRPEYEALFDRAVSQAQRILGDRQRAEDVASESVGKILAGSKREHFSLIVHGLTVDAYRKLLKEQPTHWFDEEDELLFMQQPLTFEQVEFRADFDRAVRALDEGDRQAFLLTTVRGLSEREAAPLLNIDKSTVHRRAERARAQIKEALA